MTTTDEYREQVKEALAFGPLGVNALSRKTGINVNTLQKYMERQDYFVKNEQRKWDLPNHQAVAEAVKAENNFAEVIDNQLNGIESVIELLTTNLRATITLLKAQKPPPVAAVAPRIHPRFIEIDKRLKNFEKNVISHAKAVPEEYRELIKHLDIYELVIAKGTDYLNSSGTAELASLLIGELTELSPQTIEILERFQK